MNVMVQHYSEIHCSHTNSLDSVQNPSTYVEHFTEHISYYMYHVLKKLKKKLLFAFAMYWYVLYDLQNKERLFP